MKKMTDQKMLRPMGEMSRKYDIFPSVIPTNSPGKKCHIERFHPLNTIDSRNNAPIHFLIRGTNDYIDFEGSDVVIYGKFIGEKPGVAATSSSAAVNAVSATDANAQYGPVNNFAHSLFKAIDTEMNGTSITMADQYYMYTAYFDTLFNYTKAAHKSSHGIAGWCKDTPEHMDSYKPNENAGLKERMSRVNSDGEVMFIFKPVTPIWQIKTIFPSKVDFKFTFHKNPSRAFYMMCDTGDTYDFEITGMEMWINKITVDPEYSLGVEGILHEGRLLENVLTDPRNEFHQLPSGLSTFHKDHVTYGLLPRFMMVTFLDNDAVSGNSLKNPFNFKHFDVRKIGVTVDGIDHVRPALTFHSSKKKFADVYFQMLKVLHCGNSPFAVDIQETDLDKGFFFAMFEFSQDQMGGDIPDHLVNQGTNIHLSVEFGTSLTSAITMVIHYGMNMKLSMSGFRQMMVENN